MQRFCSVLCLLVLTLSGCATAPPVEQARAFANASDAFNAASQPLLDELALAERARAWRIVKSPKEGAKDVLAVPLPGGTTRQLLLDLPADQVLALSTVGDPPATAALRKGVGTIKHYATVLVLLAENQNAEAARAELGILAANVTGVAALIPGAQAGSALITPLLAALQPLIDGAIAERNAEEFRKLVVSASPRIKELNARLRDSAEPTFRAIASDERAVIVERQGQSRGGGRSHRCLPRCTRQLAGAAGPGRPGDRPARSRRSEPRQCCHARQSGGALDANHHLCRRHAAGARGVPCGPIDP